MTPLSSTNGGHRVAVERGRYTCVQCTYVAMYAPLLFPISHGRTSHVLNRSVIFFFFFFLWGAVGASLSSSSVEIYARKETSPLPLHLRFHLSSKQKKGLGGRAPDNNLLRVRFTFGVRHGFDVCAQTCEKDWSMCCCYLRARIQLTHGAGLRATRSGFGSTGFLRTGNRSRRSFCSGREWGGGAGGAGG